MTPTYLSHLFSYSQETNTVIYPEMAEQLGSPRFMNLLFSYLDTCKDVCDHFGITTTLVPYQKEGRITGLTVKSYRNPDKASLVNTANVDDGEFEFAYDPYFDDGTDFEQLYSGIDDEDMVPDKYPAIETPIPDDDEEIISVTKNWVGALMSDMGVCPFTKGAERAGLPMGNVFYAVDRSSGFEDMYNVFWKEVVRLEQNKEADVATTLLITPEFCFENVELFDSFCNTLTKPLTALGIEDLLQLVFFHPVWSFRDGDARSSSDGQAANYARRSPWPMINLLRTSQVRTAQKGIPTGLVYKQNEQTLSKVGVDQLETMLRLRNWEATAEYSVDRSKIDALQLAQEFQSTGKIAERDLQMAYDNTPAAQKVNNKEAQMEQGNLVNVVLQALEKRLGKEEQSNEVQALSGPETSAAAMASDLLIQRLSAMVPTSTDNGETKNGAKESTQVSSSTTTQQAASNPNTIPNDAKNTVSAEGDVPDEVARARQERIEAARRAIANDLTPETKAPAMERGDQLTDVLFGKEGLAKTTSDEDVDFPEGMDPRSFY